MSESPPNLTNGFSPENVGRIYRGEPALVNGQEPAEVLTKRQFETMSQIAQGMSYRWIAAKSNRSVNTISTHANKASGWLGLLARSQLAGYFPIDPESEALEGNTLGGLEDESGHTRLAILQALSVGLSTKKIAADRHNAVSTVRTHIHDIGEDWTNVIGVLRYTMVANGIRAKYVRAIEAGKVSVEMEQVGEPTLQNLVEIEPTILHELGRGTWNRTTI